MGAGAVVRGGGAAGERRRPRGRLRRRRAAAAVRADRRRHGDSSWACRSIGLAVERLRNGKAAYSLTIELRVGMSCQGCVGAVKRVLGKMEGVESFNVDIKEQKVTVKEEKLESNLSKLVVIMWVFVVLILTTSYTAHLASVLTIQQLQPAMNDWTDRDYVGYQDGTIIEGFVRDMGFDESRLRKYTSMDQYADALDKGSANGGVTAIFDEVPYLKLFLSRYCHGYSMVGPTYKSGGFGFVFPLGSPLVPDVSRAIMELPEEDKLTRIENKWFSHPGACVRGSNGADAKLGLWRFRGLFLINVVVSCLMLLIHLAMFVSRERASGELGANSDQEPAGVFPWLRAWLRLFDASQSRRGSGGAVELNHLQGLATGTTDQ